MPSLEHNNQVKGESLDLVKYFDSNFEGPSLLPEVHKIAINVALEKKRCFSGLLTSGLWILHRILQRSSSLRSCLHILMHLTKHYTHLYSARKMCLRKLVTKLVRMFDLFEKAFFLITC